MAKIDLYNARGLAKQAVGTPGIDTTGEEISRLSGSIIKATNQYIAAETEKLKIANNIQGEVEKLKCENILYEQFEKDKQNVDNINNPYGLADRSYSSAETTIQEYAKNISNPYVREVFLQKAAYIPGQAQKQMTQWAGKQTTTNALVSVKEGMDGIINQASKMQDLNGYMGSLAQGEALITNAMPVIGVDNAYQLRQQLRKGAAESFLYPKMDNSPGTVKAYIESGKFDDVFDGKDKAQLLHTCDTIEKRNVRDIQNANKLNGAQEYQTLAQGVRNGTPDLITLENKLVSLRQSGVRTTSKEYIKWLNLRNAAVEGKFSEYTDKDARVAQEKLFKMICEKDKSTIEEFGKQSVKGLTLNRLEEMDTVLELNAHLLTTDQYNNYRHSLDKLWTRYTKGNRYAAKGNNAIERRWNKMINAPADDFNSGLKMGYNAINERYKNDKESRNAARVDFARSYNMYYQSSWNKNKNQFDYKEYTKGLLNQIYERY